MSRPMTKDALPTQDEAVAEIKQKVVVSLWPTVAVVLGMTRGSVYAAAQRGDIEIIKVGRLKKAAPHSADGLAFRRNRGSGRDLSRTKQRSRTRVLWSGPAIKSEGWLAANQLREHTRTRPNKIQSRTFARVADATDTQVASPEVGT